MLAIAGQTAGPYGLKFFEGTPEYPGVTLEKNRFFSKFEFFILFYRHRQASQLVYVLCLIFSSWLNLEVKQN